MSKAIAGAVEIGAAFVATAWVGGIGGIAALAAQGGALGLYASTTVSLLAMGVATEAGAMASALGSNSGLGVTTRTPASLHHIIRTGHQDAGHNYYDSLTFDGTTYAINATLPSESLGALPTALIPQVQIDAGPTTGTAATVSYNVDNFNFSAYGALIPGTPQLLLTIQ